MLSRAPYLLAAVALNALVVCPFLALYGWDAILEAMPNYRRLACVLIILTGLSPLGLMALGERLDYRRALAKISPKEPAHG